MEVNEKIRQTIGNELANIKEDTPLNFNELKKSAPTFANEIEQAYFTANNDSKLDNKASLPSTVTVHTNTDVGTVITTSAWSKDGESHLQVEKNSFSEKSLSDMRSTLEHEAGHEVHAKSDPDFNKINMKSDSYHRETEYKADRYANVDGSINKLLDHTQKAPEEYNFFSKMESHPNDRERIGALLGEKYGNDVFQHSGKVSERDGKFHPNRDNNGMPVTEDGKRITNWDKQIEPAINKHVDSDLKMLDKLQEGGLTDSEKAQFKQHVEQSAKEFKQEHKPEYQGAEADRASSNADSKQQQLANSFRHDDHSDSKITQANIAQEPKMAQAYAAQQLADRQIQSSDIHPEAKENASGMVRENIANGIARNEYPDVQRQERTQTSEANAPQLSMNA